MRGRFAPRLLIQLGNAQAQLLAVAQDDDARVERAEGDGEVRRDRADAGVAGEQAVILVLAVARVTHVAAFFQTQRVAMTEIPAARMLREIAADGGDVANLTRTHFRRADLWSEL